MHATRSGGMELRLVRMEQRDDRLLFDIYAAVYRQGIEQWGLGVRETEQILQLQYRAKAMSYRNQFPEAVDCLINHGDIEAGMVTVNYGVSMMSLIDLMILPECQRLGLGTQVVRQLQSEAEQLGAAIKLHVDTTNTNAYDWYARMGFEVTNSTLTHHELEWCPEGIVPRV